MQSRIRRIFAGALRSALVVGLMVSVLAPVNGAMAQKARPAPLPKPTEAQLGAPYYPGASFVGQISADMSRGPSYYWVFETSDPVAKVVAFYKQKTGLVPLDAGDGNYLFTIKKGSNLYFPDQGFTIEPNKILTGSPKTAISFIKAK